MTALGTTSRWIAVGAAAFAAASLTSATANAQIPGVDPTSTVVVADSSMIQVAVDAPNLTAGTVSVTVQNNTSSTLSCSGINGSRPGTVTESEIVARSVSYYAQYPTLLDPTITTTITGSSGLPTININLGSLTSAMPSSVASLLRPQFGAKSRLAEMYTSARVAGHVGAITSTVSVPARSNTVLTVPLGDPSASPRVSFTAAAILGCSIGGQDYVFAGYQTDGTPTIPLGSLNLPQTGRFGS